MEYNEGLGSIRTKKAPKKTGIGYKVFYQKDGKLYPPMVANPGGVDTPIGVWLDADAAPIVGNSKTGRPQVKNGGKGTQGGSGTLAYRPGWHLGLIPYAIQFNRKDENGEKTLFPKDFVWAEVEYAADKNYQKEAEAEGYTENGKYRHSYAGLKHLPTDGYYIYRTNPNPETDPWIITGAMKVNRILSKKEVDDLVRKAGREPQRVEGEGLGFASFRISRNKKEFYENWIEAKENIGIVRNDINEIKFPIIEIHTFQVEKGVKTSKKLIEFATEKGIIGKHHIIIGNEIGEVYITKNFYEKSISKSAVDNSENYALQIASTVEIIGILNNSIDVEIHPNVIKKNGERIWGNLNKDTLIHRLYSAVRYKDELYRIKVTLKENLQNKNTIYTIQNIKIELLDPSGVFTREQLVTSNSIPSAILLKGVEKSYEKGIFLLDCCKKTHTKTIGSTDTTSLTPSQQFQNRRQARASQLKKGDNITYTEDDFFRVECKDLKRVHEAIMFWYELSPNKSNPWLYYLLLDDKGYPIFTELGEAELFIDSYKLYKDEWKRDFIFADGSSENEVRSWVLNNHIGKGADENLYKEITKVHHKPSLLLIYEWIKKSIIIRDADAEYEKMVNSYLEKIKKHIDSLKDDELIDKMVNAHKRAFSDNVTIPKQITLADCYKYCGTDENKPSYTGIYHDPKGFAVVTNGRILYAHNNLYESKSKGKIIDKSGKVIDSNFPDWQAVVNSYANNTKILTPIDIDRDDLYRKLCMYERKFKYRRHHIPVQPFAIRYGYNEYLWSAELLKGIVLMSYAHKDVKFYLSVIKHEGFRGDDVFFVAKSSDGSVGMVGGGVGGFDGWYLDETNKYGLIQDKFTNGEPFLLDSVYQYAQGKKDGKKSNNLQLAKAKMKMAAARIKLMKM